MGLVILLASSVNSPLKKDCGGRLVPQSNRA
jgi:hypothetical protein